MSKSLLILKSKWYSAIFMSITKENKIVRTAEKTADSLGKLDRGTKLLSSSSYWKPFNLENNPLA